MRNSPAATFWWETETDADDGSWALVGLVPPDFPRDVETTSKLADALRLTTERCGGWNAVYTKMKQPALPWYSELTAEEHSVIWAKLLWAFRGTDA